MADKPNVLLITTDTRRWDTLKCMGSEFAISPNLDKLANEGVLFENAHTSSPVCMPARCSLMAGVHTHIHGCIENGFGRFDHLPALPDLLKDAGYYNIMVGKTHFGPVHKSFDIKRITYGGKSADSDDVYAEFIRPKGYWCCPCRLRISQSGFTIQHKRPRSLSIPFQNPKHVADLP